MSQVFILWFVCLKARLDTWLHLLSINKKPWRIVLLWQVFLDLYILPVSSDIRSNASQSYHKESVLWSKGRSFCHRFAANESPLSSSLSPQGGLESEKLQCRHNDCYQLRSEQIRALWWIIELRFLHHLFIRCQTFTADWMSVLGSWVCRK